jgi:DHA2 family multidrug resistance protein
LAATVAPGNAGLIGLPSTLDLSTAAGLAAIDTEVTTQAFMVAYINDFWVMMVLTLVTLPFLLVLRPPRRGQSGTAEITH